MQKRWEFIEYDINEAIELQQVLKIHPLFCQLLVQRGIRTFDEAKQFFRPQLSQLNDPFLMKDMEIAVQRIAEAIIKKEKILVYGDYDVDGTSAVALVFSFLSNFHQNLDYYIPDREKEGYGISIKSIEFASQNNFNLVIALDCGTKAHEAIDFANEKGIDFIICDHHLPDTSAPNALAFLNPKQADCQYPYKELSGCAIGFKLIEAFAQVYNIDFETKVLPLLDLVVISLACDYVPLTKENRALAYFGLEQLNKSPRTGLKALIKLLNTSEEYSIRDIVFGIGPLLNAAGRIEHGSTAVKLLIENKDFEANELAITLLENNQKRKEIELLARTEAQDMVINDITSGEKKALILKKGGWHKGVLGIIAAKMVDEFYKPTIIFTESNGRLVGSARSVNGFDIYKALEQCEDLLVNYGGHPFAAGLTIKPSNFEVFCERFQNIVSQTLTPVQEQPLIYIDAELKLDTINEKFWNLLRQFAPFGPHNMRPIFISKNLKDTGYSKIVKDRHLKLVVQQENSSPLEGIGFDLAEHFNNITAQKPFQMCYVLEENNFKGKTQLQAGVRDIRFY